MGTRNAGQNSAKREGKSERERGRARERESESWWEKTGALDAATLKIKMRRESIETPSCQCPLFPVFVMWVSCPVTVSKTTQKVAPFLTTVTRLGHCPSGVVQRRRSAPVGMHASLLLRTTFPRTAAAFRPSGWICDVLVSWKPTVYEPVLSRAPTPTSLK